MTRLLDEATGALVRLDSEKLERLQQRALRLQALLVNGARLSSLPETLSRFRVFARVLETTGEDARILERISVQPAQRAANGGNPWAV